jgi:hypothetical protein
MRSLGRITKRMELYGKSFRNEGCYTTYKICKVPHNLKDIYNDHKYCWIDWGYDGWIDWGYDGFINWGHDGFIYEWDVVINNIETGGWVL